MAGLAKTRDLFLWCMSAIYLFAFASLYIQIPGLYGDSGILPAKLVKLKAECKDEHSRCSEWAAREPSECQENAGFMLKQCRKSCKVCQPGDQGQPSLWDVVSERPSLLHITPWLGLSRQRGMELLCLLGIILSFIAVVFHRGRNSLVFAALWFLYLSLFQVGQTFLWFQWDILLMETGFLTILVALHNLHGWYQHDSLALWLLKWLLFRLMFASGVVKLTSRCPTWWGLTALDWHYESQCIPTPLAWYFHQLPAWFQKLSVATVYVIEIPIPFLFFSPVRSQRLFAFYSQVLLMLLIFLTGNYNFFNLLTVALCVSLLDDNYLMGTKKEPLEGQKGHLGRILHILLNLLVYGGLIYGTVVLFKLRLSFSPFKIDSKVAFTEADLNKFLKATVPLSIWMGTLFLAWEILKAIYSAMFHQKGLLRRACCLAGTLILSVAACCMFVVSLVNYTRIEETTQTSLPKPVWDIYNVAKNYKLSSSYGLFRRMTGVGGRPELIVEGSNDINHGWKEYNFLYKPGNVSQGLPFVAPHQPRLDWQMWFAALGSYQHNPWFLNLVYRLLQGKPEVLELMGENPFPKKAPKYIKATLWKYHYTRMDKKHKWYSRKNWWVRDEPLQYLPPVSLESKEFIDYLKQNGLYQSSTKSEKDKSQPSTLLHLVNWCRACTTQMEGFRFVMALFLSAFTLKVTLSFLISYKRVAVR